jgi:hypothetical protein
MLQKSVYYDSPEFGKHCLILDCNFIRNTAFVLFEKNNKKYLITRNNIYFSSWKQSRCK